MKEYRKRKVSGTGRRRGLQGMRRYIWDRGTALFLCSALLLSFSGCGALPAFSGKAEGKDGIRPGENSGDEIELVEPLTLPEGWESVEYRNFYDAEVYDAAVYPYTEEYSFSIDVTLDHFNYFPGESVKKGDALVYADLEGIDEAIETMEEQLLSMEEDYLEYKSEVEESLEEPEDEVERLEDILNAYQEAEPAMYEAAAPAEVPVSPGDAPGGEDAGNTGERTVTEAYKKWKDEYTDFEGQYRILAHQNNVARLELSNRTALYELDHAYQAKKLEELKAQRRNYILTSSMAGEVSAVTLKEAGSRIPKAEAVVAVSDNSRKLVKCDYISSSVIRNAEEIYVVVNGARYEAEYQPYTSAEYSALSSRGETAVSTFKLAEDADVSIGDYAVVVVLKKGKKGVLSVPNEAIHREGAEKYVYLRGNDGKEMVFVETGMSDGAYTEITSGLKEGDQVLVSNPTTAGTGRLTLEKTTYSSHYNGNGSFYYPEIYQIENPVAYGTAHFVDYEVELYQYVKKGDTIATIYVEGDQIALTRYQLQLTRLKERLAEWLEENGEADPKDLEDRQEPIRELEELISEINRDYAAVKITAPQSGIVTQLADHKEKDELRKEEVLGQIADANNCYVVVEGSDMLYYGNQVTVYYQDREGQEKEVEGKVVNLSGDGVGNALRTSYALIQIPPDVAGEMTASAMQGDFWNRQGLFRVVTEARKMENVILVPRKAVKTIQLVPYVQTADPDGGIVARTFLAGGSDRDYYWIVDGLSEGEELCLE